MDPSPVDPVRVAEVLVGAATVRGVATDVQLAVVGALLDGFLDAKVDVATVVPAEPDGFDPAGFGSLEDESRRLVGYMVAMVMLCRDPLTIAQIDRADAFAEVLGHGRPEIHVGRVSLEEGPEAGYWDLQTRVPAEKPEEWDRAIALPEDGVPAGVTDARVYEVVSGWRNLPDGTLGRAFVEFYDRFRFDLPGTPGTTGVQRPASWRVYHDMSHVIAGYGTSGVGELAVTAMTYAINRDDDRWAALMNAFAVYQAGMTPGEAFDFVSTSGALARPGATDVLADALKRGRRCTGDFSRAHFAALAPLPIEAVRAQFGVLPVTATLAS
jgi:hypothetical protein